MWRYIKMLSRHEFLFDNFFFAFIARMFSGNHLNYKDHMSGLLTWTTSAHPGGEDHEQTYYKGLRKYVQCFYSCTRILKPGWSVTQAVPYLVKPWLVTRFSCNIRSSWIKFGRCSHWVGGKRLGINRANKSGFRDENSAE